MFHATNIIEGFCTCRNQRPQLRKGRINRTSKISSRFNDSTPSDLKTQIEVRLLLPRHSFSAHLISPPSLGRSILTPPVVLILAARSALSWQALRADVRAYSAGHTAGMTVHCWQDFADEADVSAMWQYADVSREWRARGVVPGLRVPFETTRTGAPILTQTG